MIQTFNKISAMLKMGKWNKPILIKSLTPPSQTLSIKFPNAHAKKNPRKIQPTFFLQYKR